MKTLSDCLLEITGMDAITLQPAAGAHGELTGLLMVRAYHQSQGNARKKILIPDSAHGTNPATAATVGLRGRKFEIERPRHGRRSGAGGADE
jgi:glycine dehydrogenase subunit 2